MLAPRTSILTTKHSYLQIKLSDLTSLKLVDKKGYLTAEMDCGKDGGVILLRKAEGIQDWFKELSACWQECNARGMETTKQFWTKQKLTGPDLEHWLLARQTVAEKYLYTTSGSVVQGEGHTKRSTSARRRRPRSECKYRVARVRLTYYGMETLGINL